MHTTLKPESDLTDAAEALRATIAARNRREWFACLLVAVGFTAIALTHESVLSILSAAEIVTAAAYIAWRLHRDGRAHLPIRARLPARDLPRLYADELLRQARLLQAAPRWYVLPLALGLVGLHADSALKRAHTSAQTFAFAVSALALVVIALVNVRAAAALRSRASNVLAGGGNPHASAQR